MYLFHSRTVRSLFVPAALTALATGCGAAGEDVAPQVAAEDELMARAPIDAPIDAVIADPAIPPPPIVNGTLMTEPNWVVSLGFNSTFCSAWVMNEHWLLTAAHCLKSVVNGQVVTVTRANAPGGRETIYTGPARFFMHPEFNDTAAHDVGVIHLDNAGLRIDLTGVAKMYSDTRRPWASSSLPRDISAVGWGFVTQDPNNSTSCLPSSSLLRTTTSMTVDVSSATTPFVTSPIGSTFPCSGDSGTPWLLLRGDNSAGFAQMGFAVHSRRRGSPVKAQAPTIDDNRAFIEDTVRSLNSTDVYGTGCSEKSLGGFRFRTCEQTGRGWGQLKSSLGTCMQATGSASGSSVTLATCNQTVNAQVWGLFPSGEIKNLLNTSNCLEAPSSISGTAMRVATCNKGAAQRFGNGPQGQLTLGTAFNQCVTAMSDPVNAPLSARTAPQTATLAPSATLGLPCTNIYCIPKVQVQACGGTGGGRFWDWGTF
jgi:hypothetical protein